MTYITDQQNQERETLAVAISTVTKVEPREFANQIHHNVVVMMHEEGLTVDDTLERMEIVLHDIEIDALTGNNLDGWKYRTVYLTAKQQKTIHSMLELMLRMGGTFSPYQD